MVQEHFCWVPQWMGDKCLDAGGVWAKLVGSDEDSIKHTPVRFWPKLWLHVRSAPCIMCNIWQPRVSSRSTFSLVLAWFGRRKEKWAGFPCRMIRMPRPCRIQRPASARFGSMCRHNSRGLGFISDQLHSASCAAIGGPGYPRGRPLALSWRGLDGEVGIGLDLPVK
jgi:hypothetical protein